ncbi:sigma-54 dependent transcriptional regulator [Marinoscillum sp. 108]|jgi:DNA-binding NtrC family response regulator|uniref:sigma-54-dependent transcriptional regulator n=1 Tax=Marinoscillum sp. 108 TaxID=2653151 RepID=UPI0012EFA9B2|nr:sigma-54 dependent transcriptional regulator [Marinoscillum sp. 108]VXD14785.1 DNA-binding transcriptional regulator NtrC [Marinoscillum sp. 108]
MGQKPFTIFVVEDDDWYRKLLHHNLTLNPEYRVETFANGEAFLKQINEKPDVVTLDYRLPDYNGEDLLKKIKAADPGIEVLIISEQSEIETAVSLLKAGAYDYITKTEDIRDRLLNVVQHINKNRSLKTQLENLQTEVAQKYEFETSIIGQSKEMKKVFQMMQKATTNNISVIITGETGTGKEMVAKSIHYNSPRSKKSFVAVNMSAIPKELAESELFGHEKGAFTGAANRHAGKFEQAHGGTLFLDEIGEMAPELQAKLLRALQEKEIVRVGGTEPVKVDCRIIAATHRNLLDEMKKGAFREDLYYRLFGLPVELPPLRDRENDIVILAKHFAESFYKENDMPPKTFTKDALKKLMTYSYPGNIRELKSIVELSVVMAEDHEITAEDITFTQSNPITELFDEALTMKDYELRIVKMYLKNHNDDIKKVAELLDIGQSTIYRMLKKEK